jgi:AcrR family transcriptional regulator
VDEPPRAARPRGGGCTRQRLLDAATQLLSEGGYGAAPVGAIAERAGLSMGALYRHFPSKAELFVEVFRSAAQRDLAAFGDLDADTRPVDLLMVGINTYARRMLANRRLAWALVHEPVDPLVDAERLLYRREYTRLVVRLLRQAVDQQEVPYQDTAISAAAITGALSEALVGPLSPISADAEPDDLIVEHIVRFCRRAIGADETSDIPPPPARRRRRSTKR